MSHDRTTRLAATIVLLMGLVFFLFPLTWMVSTSLKTPLEVSQPLKLIPESSQWQNYPEALGQMKFANALANTIVITTLGVIGQVFSCSLVGFGFAKFRFRGRNVLFIAMLASMMLPPQVTMIPVFILFRQLGLVDSLLALIIPAWFGTPFFIFMFRQFFTAVPDELLEAARVDGASNFLIYRKILLPMSWPVVAVVSVYTFIGSWNEFLGPLLYLLSPENRTLSLALAGFSQRYGNSDASVNLLMAASVITMLPCIVLFFAAQRYFVQSEVTSAIKG